MEVQKIGGELNYLTVTRMDQTGHHIHSQCSESVFVSTEYYPHKGSDEDFEVPEKSFREKAFSIKIMDTPE